jgi:hypothetical protein
MRQTIGQSITMRQYSSWFNLEQNRELGEQAFQKEDGGSVLDYKKQAYRKEKGLIWGLK